MADQEVLGGLRTQILEIMEDKLKDLGVSSNWKGIPENSFRKALEVIRHQTSLTAKVIYIYSRVFRLFLYILGY